MGCLFREQIMRVYLAKDARVSGDPHDPVIQTPRAEVDFAEHADSFKHLWWVECNPSLALSFESTNNEEYDGNCRSIKFPAEELSRVYGYVFPF